MAINLFKTIPKVQTSITSKHSTSLFFTTGSSFSFPSYPPVALAVCSMSYEKELAAAKKAASLAARLCQAILSFLIPFLFSMKSLQFCKVSENGCLQS